jgi:hypothetical protein
VTGGSVCNKVFIISLSTMRIEIKPNMLNARKEHASIFLNSKIYVLGGYNGNRSKFLDDCECFDFERN